MGDGKSDGFSNLPWPVTNKIQTPRVCNQTGGDAIDVRTPEISARGSPGEIWRAEDENGLKTFGHGQICTVFWSGSGPKTFGQPANLLAQSPGSLDVPPYLWYCAEGIGHYVNGTMIVINWVSCAGRSFSDKEGLQCFGYLQIILQGIEVSR